MANKAMLPFKGTRDISGDDMRFRQSVMEIIRQTYQLFGFEPLETPVIERRSTLLGKYGEEAENLLFMLGGSHSDAGLRYDHTVPLSRFAAANWQDLPKPYKRYAIGPVFRAENTQSGRYRQFYQCDFDTLGSDSLAVDAEIVAINYMVLTKLGFTDQYQVQLNDRRLLNAMAHEMGFVAPEASVMILRAWDKLDKTSLSDVFEYVVKEMERFGFDRAKLETSYKPVTEMLYALTNAPAENVLATLRENFKSQETLDAIDLVEQLIAQVRSLGVPVERFQFNPLLARGLGYYTGPIFETVVKEAGIGSISGGGRFDNLIEAMGGPSVPASGSSFGLDRIIVVMETLGLRPKSSQTTKVFVTIFDPDNGELTDMSLSIAKRLRESDVAVEVYSGKPAKLGKQIGIASKKMIRLAVVMGPDELAEGEITLKDLDNNSEERVGVNDIVGKVKVLLS
jgi:histidyl-tRNA synthetase